MTMKKKHSATIRSGIYCALIAAAILLNIFYNNIKQNFDKYRYECTLNTNIECPYGEPGGAG